jgi:Fic/DOC family
MSPNELLARHLDSALKVAKNNVVRSSDLTARTRQYLAARGSLLEVIKGWYLLAPPGVKAGETTLWHGNFWNFLNEYLKDRFGSDYCLTAETSLDLWGGKTQTPLQIIVMTKGGGAGKTDLAFGTSLMIYRDEQRFPDTPSEFEGLNVMSRGMALAKVSPTYYQRDNITAQVVLKVTPAVEIAKELLRWDKSSSANRVVGALLAMREKDKAREVLSILSGAKFSVAPENPFEEYTVFLDAATPTVSPYAGRIRLLWAQMREEVIANFEAPPNTKISKAEYLDQISEIYRHDAYHSLSIEGYSVTPDLIELVRSGQYLEDNKENQKHIDAMAARGYYQAFQTVRDGVGKILDGTPPGTVAEQDLQTWYQQLFSPFVDAGVIPSFSLAGYRERRVFITNSMHVPPPRTAVADAMEALFELLKTEEHPGVRAVLGHFIFVFIHPYSDGNGRVGRFLMNAMLASGGYPWTVIRVKRRDEYMAALEAASVGYDIAPFARFVREEMHVDWRDHQKAS